MTITPSPKLGSVDHDAAFTLVFRGIAMAMVDGHPDVAAARLRTQAAMDKLIKAAKAEGKLRPDATFNDLRLVFAATRAAKQVSSDGWERMLTLLVDGLAA